MGFLFAWIDLDGLWDILNSAGEPALFVLGVALGTGLGYWLVARGPMGKALKAAGEALQTNAEAFIKVLDTVTKQNEQLIKLQNDVDTALDANRALRKELDAAEKRAQLRDAEHAAELERVRAEFAEKVAGLEKAVAERDKRVAELERKVAAKDKRIDELLTRIAELEKANQMAIAEREQVESKLNALQARVNHANGDTSAGEDAKTGPERAGEA